MKIVLIWGIAAIVVILTYVVQEFFKIDQTIVMLWILTLYSAFNYIRTKNNNSDEKDITKTFKMMIFLFVTSVLTTLVMTLFGDVVLWY